MPRDGVEDLQRRIAELMVAVAARDIFIAVAAHELRNPMTPIIGQIELLLAAVQAGRSTPEQIAQRLQRLERLMRHYMKRANVLLDVSRITTGNLQLEPEAFDLAGLLRDVVSDYDDMARRQGIPVTVAAPGSLMVTWDRLALEQIMDNLISNALKYGAHSPVEVSAAAEGGQVRVVVRDGGPGIAEADRERVFGRFERAVGQGVRRSGFGVGLWVVGQLAVAMGGMVTVADAPGGGALLTLTLPQHVPPLPQSAPVLPQPPSALPQPEGDAGP